MGLLQEDSHTFWGECLPTPDSVRNYPGKYWGGGTIYPLGLREVVMELESAKCPRPFSLISHFSFNTHTWLWYPRDGKLRAARTLVYVEDSGAAKPCLKSPKLETVAIVQ